jgi:hypothetical protein
VAVQHGTAAEVAAESRHGMPGRRPILRGTLRTGPGLPPGARVSLRGAPHRGFGSESCLPATAPGAGTGTRSIPSARYARESAT